jgi:hypothetical protein
LQLAFAFLVMFFDVGKIRTDLTFAIRREWALKENQGAQ